MKLNFRQGIARHQSDVNGNPTFLQRSGANSQYVDLIVSPIATTLVFAHKTGTYLVEELKTVSQAWGPISSQTTYLYWDINLLSGALTRSITLLPPIYSSSAPVSPAADQHWFDTVDEVFRVWNGNKWIEKIRIFAGYVSSGAIIHAYPVGSQAGLTGNFDAGNIVLDSFGMPLRQNNGTFVTTSSQLNVINLGSVSAQFESILMNGMAAEEIPKFSVVQLHAGKRIVLARSTDYTTRISGVITEDLYEGELARVISSGVIRNQNWTWPTAFINRPLFCGATGEISTTAPITGVVQQLGFVYDVDSIFVDIKQPVVLDDPDSVLPPIDPPPVSAPIANFTMSTTSGLAPLTVNFTDTSTGATSLEWDFTNDGFVDSTSATPSYTYASPGTYTVKLRAINSFGSDQEIKSNIIQVAAPNPGIGNVNLGLSFGSPSQIFGGQAFNFQVLVTNDGTANATNVARELKIRASDKSEIIVISAPSGSTITRTGPITRIILPMVNISSGNFASAVLQLQVQSTATAVQFEGTTSSVETDPELNDNKTSLTIAVRP